MNIHWKIFNVINFICLTLVISYCAWAVFANPPSIDTLTGKLFYGFIIIAILAVTINCLHNVFLTRLYADSSRMTTNRQIFFWFLLVIFAGVISLFIYYSWLELYLRLINMHGAYKRMGGVRYFTQFLSISISGLYIIVAQVILFFRIKRSYRLGLNNSVAEIGNES